MLIMLGVKMHIKNEIRVIGFDDGPFVRIKGNKALVVGVILRAREYLDGVLSTYVTIDGLDATGKIIELINKSRHCDQLRVVLFDGLAVAGFNLVDIHRVNEDTGKVVIAVTSNKPDRVRFVSALKNLDCYEERRDIVERAGEVESVEINGKSIYFQCAGISVDEAKVILKKTSVRGAVPEAIRMAHIIASGIVDGESRGRP